MKNEDAVSRPPTDMRCRGFFSRPHFQTNVMDTANNSRPPQACAAGASSVSNIYKQMSLAISNLDTTNSSRPPTDLRCRGFFSRPHFQTNVMDTTNSSRPPHVYALYTVGDGSFMHKEFHWSIEVLVNK